MNQEIQLGTSDVGMFPMALHFDGSHTLFMTLSSGAALYLHDPALQLSIFLFFINNLLQYGNIIFY